MIRLPLIAALLLAACAPSLPSGEPTLPMSLDQRQAQASCARDWTQPFCTYPDYEPDVSALHEISYWIEDRVTPVDRTRDNGLHGPRWQSCWETLQSSQGDCEDFALLAACIYQRKGFDRSNAYLIMLDRRDAGGRFHMVLAVRVGTVLWTVADSLGTDPVQFLSRYQMREIRYWLPLSEPGQWQRALREG